MNPQNTSYRLATLVLRAALLLALFSAGWIVYKKLPQGVVNGTEVLGGETTVQLVMRPSAERSGSALDITVGIYPVDIVAARHEYFTERRAGKRFDDFLSERMNGRAPITARLDRQGQAQVVVRHGNWWVHAVLAGEEDLEWRLAIEVSGPKQTIELTPQNAYTRTKSF